MRPLFSGRIVPMIASGMMKATRLPMIGKGHPVGGQGSTLVVILGQFGGQGNVRHRNERVGSVEQEVSDGVIGAQQELAVGRRAVPHHGEHQPERDEAEEQEGPPSPPAGAHPVGEEADQRVVDVVPGAANEDSQGGVGGFHPDHIGHKDGEQHLHGRIGAGEPEVADAVEEFGAAGKTVLDGGGHGSFLCASGMKRVFRIIIELNPIPRAAMFSKPSIARRAVAFWTSRLFPLNQFPRRV